jgi:hypothetical protein
MANITKRRDNIYRPKGWSPVDDIKARFDRLNQFVQARNGWIISLPGKAEVMIEVLPDSTLPSELRDAGYVLTEIEGSQRIIPGSITERLELSSSGAFVAASENSTKPIFMRSHSGVCRVRRYRFTIA